MFVSISEDYKEKPIYEKQILGKYLLPSINFEKTEILLLWRRTANREYLEKFKNLKTIIRYGTGYDNVDLSYVKSQRIDLFNNPDYCINEVADTVIALILSRMRRLNQYHQISKNIIRDTSLYKFKNTIDTGCRWRCKTRPKVSLPISTSNGIYSECHNIKVCQS